MKNSYLCPYCKGHLKIKDYIIFAAKTSENNKRGLIFISPQLGDYHHLSHSSFKLSEGDKIQFLCPLCHANLAALSINQNLAEVIMVDLDGKEHDIYFSEIVGEKCTYKIHNKDIQTFGENSDKYVNYFGS